MPPLCLLSARRILCLYLAFAAVYTAGLFIPLMENDSAQHASMAMRMALNNDFLNIYKGENAYLDKPHMHFWLAALSMKIFGINAIAYRIPALLCLALGAFSTKKLAQLLYINSNLGHVAALIFLSSQTIILSAHDVRTDAVLTGFIIFSIWQFIRFIRVKSTISAVLAGVAAALAFSSKGLMALVIIGFCVLSYLLYSREWKRFFNVKLIATAAAFVAGIVPVLVAYHHQFGGEGIRFILFNQSINRLNAKGFEETSPDYFFFFHTLLWAFLPFSAAFYTGAFEKTAWFIKNRFRRSQAEFLTLGGFWLVMLLFSFSKFKLPHYLNGLIPVLSVFTAAYIFQLAEREQVKKIRVLWIIQMVVIFSGLAAAGWLVGHFTGIPNVGLYLAAVLLFGVLLNQIFSKENLFTKFIFNSLLFGAALNLFLNGQFYPVLAQYQGSLKLAEYVKKQQLPLDKIYMLRGYESWNFDFYTMRNTPRATPEQLEAGDFLVVHHDHKKNIKRNYRIVRAEDDFRVTRLSLKFLKPKTRPDKLSRMYLIQLLN